MTFLRQTGFSFAIWLPVSCSSDGKTAGPSTTLRSGRDDNSVVTARAQVEDRCPTTELSSRPERSVVEGPAVFPIAALSMSDAGFRTENR